MGGKAVYLKRIWTLLIIFNLFILYFASITPSAGALQENWSEDIRLTFTENTSYTPAIAIWENNVHVVWAESGEGRDIFLWYINSTDGGNTWNLPIPLVDTPHVRVGLPKIAVDKNSIHVIWLECNERRIYYIRSVDNGITWSTEKILADMVYHLQLSWDIGVSENNVHVVYMDMNRKLSHTKSNDNGLTWTAPEEIVSTDTRVAKIAIAVIGRRIHIVYDDNKYFPSGYCENDIFYLKSEDNGLTWGKELNITQTPMTSSHFADIGIKNDYLYVVYSQEEAKRQVYFSYSEDSGSTWARNIRLSNSTANIHFPSIAVNEVANEIGLFVVWTDHRDGSSQIYFKNSSDGGKTWSSDTRLTYAIPYSSWPDIAADENSVHVVWCDLRDGNDEVYYKRHSISVPTLKAIIDIDPDTLNIKSKGTWITAYIELPEGHDANDIDISSILLESSIPAENHPVEIDDYDNDGIL
ncbi:MAG: exo-alpha-sialidase, partial [Thermoplasmata archaeon]